MLKVSQLELVGRITSFVCLRDELMVATHNGHIQRVKWDGTIHNDYCIDLSRVPFCDDQLVMKGNLYILNIYLYFKHLKPSLCFEISL